MSYSSDEDIDNLYTDPYNGQSFSVVKFLHRVNSNAENIYSDKCVIERGLTFVYDILLNTKTCELKPVNDEIVITLCYGLDRITYCKFDESNEYVYHHKIRYDIAKEIRNECKFMHSNCEIIKLSEVRQLTKSFINSVDKFNEMIAKIRQATM